MNLLNQKQYAVSLLKGLLTLIENDKMVVEEWGEKRILDPDMWTTSNGDVEIGKIVTLELYYATENRN